MARGNVGILAVIAGLGEHQRFNAYYNTVGDRIKEWVYSTHIHRYNQTTHKDSIVARHVIRSRGNDEHASQEVQNQSSTA